MTAPAAQWQLDRLSTSAREAAEIASLGAGVSLSSWLAKLIGETCAAEGVAPPAEPPKILEFTRELRDRVPSTPRLQPVIAQPSSPPVAANTPAPSHAAAGSTLRAERPRHRARRGATRDPAPARCRAAAAAGVPPDTDPTPVPPAAPMPAPTPLVAPVSTYRPQPAPQAPLQQSPPQAPRVPAPPAAPVAREPIAPATFAVPPSVTAPHPVPLGATMLPIAAMVAAQLGTRRGDDVPETLLADIATRGVRQPVTLRRSASHPEQYEIICGHRRWRAAQRVGLAQIPAIVVTQDDAAAILASLTENLQLGNLSVIEEAQAYLRLLTQCAADVSAVTAATGRERKHIVQSMRLLGLPPLVRHLIGSGMLSREHAFVLLDAPHPEALADAILAEHLSVDAARQRIAAGAEATP